MTAETDRIEQDINQSRHALNDTLSALGDKLSPGQMLDEAIGLVQGQAGAFAGKLGRQVRDNPLPTALVAAGIAWLIMSQRQGRRASLEDHEWQADSQMRRVEEARWRTPRRQDETDADYHDRLFDDHAAAINLKQRAGETVEAFKHRVSETISKVEQTAETARQRLSSALSDGVHFAQDQTRRLGDKAEDAAQSAQQYYDHNPLVSGALAVAVGALIGSAMPLSSAERKSLGGMADRAVRTGADLAERGAQMVEERADAMH